MSERIELAKMRADAEKIGRTQLLLISAERVIALVEAVEAAHTLADYHKDFLGLPVLSEANMDAAVEQWARLRAALARFDFGDGR